MDVNLENYQNLFNSNKFYIIYIIVQIFKGITMNLHMGIYWKIIIS